MPGRLVPELLPCPILRKRGDGGKGRGPDATGTVYLIITHPNFASNVQPLADWHHREGMNTEVLSISTTDPQVIKNEIVSGLSAYYHARVEYPDFPTAETAVTEVS